MLKEIPIKDYEKVVEVKDDTVGLHAYIAIHNTSLGPSLGGVRIYPYKNTDAALEDVLRLSKAMSYKSSLAETGLGGGKSVIIGDPKHIKTKELLLSFATAVNELKGKYIAAEDVGTNADDILILREKTPFVSALPLHESSGDPSRFTAFGVLKGILAAAQTLWGNTDLKGKVIAIQGVGHVGSELAQFLFWQGADLIISDIDEEQVAELASLWGASTVAPAEIMEVPCDIFSPCALGGILNQDTIPKLKCQAIAGAANNQLRSSEDGALLMKKNILYAPDYVINAGGILNVCCEFEPQGYDPRNAREKISKIYDTLLTIFDRAKKEGKPTNFIADEIAEYKLTHHIGRRLVPLTFH